MASRPATRKLFVNLSVRDLQRSVAFFTKLGFTFNPQFTDEHATCMILSDEAFVMLLEEARFRDFTKHQQEVPLQSFDKESQHQEYQPQSNQ